jgi:type VI secretion system protein ImpH
MAATNGQPTNAVMEEISRQPQKFDFFWAVRLLQAHFPDQPRIGHGKLLQQDPIRFGQKPSLAFEATSIHSFELGEVPRLQLTAFGLFGPNGPMPACMTEYALLPDSALAPFADVFHHRLISLFFRAWESAQKATDLDRTGVQAPLSGSKDEADKPSGEKFSEQRFSRFISSLFGFGLASLQHSSVLPDNARLYYSGQLVPQWRNAEGLEAILGHYFNLPARVEQFVGRWNDIPEENYTRLGGNSKTAVLGQTTLAGRQFWDRRMNFRIHLGPMDLEDFLKFMPHELSFERLRAWVLDYVGQEFIWDLRLILKETRVPPTALGGTSRLGWTTFLCAKGTPFGRDADDVILDGANAETMGAASHG